MDTVLGKLANQKYPCIIAGDINIDLVKCNDNCDTAEYVDTLLTNNFMPAIILPTRITSRTASLILLITFITMMVLIVNVNLAC